MDSFPCALSALLSISFSISFLVHCLHHSRLWHSFFFLQIVFSLSLTDIGAHHPIDRALPLLVYASPHNPLRVNSMGIHSQYTLYDLCIK
ncbi:hypothetical protein B0H10DRAFT_2072864 [Mycena sp. CBHHK59/15]|nr:hypothetical protein B0H10DRAFT_2072864 [Mycena sp. CBHHK59/15]